MKKMKRILMMTVLLVLATASVALAAACRECGGSNRYSTCPGVGSHPQKGYAQMDGTKRATHHVTYCEDCVNNGYHTATCSKVSRGEEAHSFGYSGEGATRKRVCSKCGYTEDAPCTHEYYHWLHEASVCRKQCNECKVILSNGEHKFYIRQTTSSHPDVKASEHDLVCSVCGYIKSVRHTFSTKSRALPKPKVPIYESLLRVAASHHDTTYTCTGCKYASTEKAYHRFRNNVCTDCGVKREILPVVKSAKGTQKGKASSRTFKTPARWYWSGTTWYYYKSGTVTTYTYKMKISWKKNTKAYGYVISATPLKAGDFVYKVVANQYSQKVTKKTSYTYTLTSVKKLKKAKVYITPINKNYGFLGKSKAVTIKLK